MKKTRKGSKNGTDRVMLKLQASLIRDFQDTIGDPQIFSHYRDHILSGDVKRIRSYDPTLECDSENPYSFKMGYQLSSTFKRYRFKKDLYTDSELQDMAIAKFLSVQDVLLKQDLLVVQPSVKLMLDLAAKYIAHVLGPYDDEEHRERCRFGRKASVGIPARAACEAARWELPISGTKAQADWFDSEMSSIPCVQEYWATQREGRETPTYQLVDALRLTLVPKTFKSLRVIMPNTTLGGYISYGLGEMIRVRLQRKGFCIKSLQMRHRYLAKEGSIHKQWVTADLSSASDSISVALVERLFPKDWFEIMNRTRIGKVVLPNGSCIESRTFCTMGIGYTFPLQTLVFLSLLKAIETMLYNRLDRRTISVYGDDMIYHRRMHKWVVYYFEQLSFTINLDKTFSEGGFRESCGGDYHTGVDVRPFQPQNGPAYYVTPKSYEAMLYKLINGLLMRWSEHEIPETLRFLRSELVSTCGKIKIVPSGYPDDSGVQSVTTAGPSWIPAYEKVFPKHLGHGVYRFFYLSFKPEMRKEVRHAPYLWLTLNRRDLRLDYQGHGTHRVVPASVVLNTIDELCGVNVAEPVLITRQVRDQRATSLRSSCQGHPDNEESRVQCQTATFVTVSHTGRYTRQSGISLYGNR